MEVHLVLPREEKQVTQGGDRELKPPGGGELAWMRVETGTPGPLVGRKGHHSGWGLAPRVATGHLYLAGVEGGLSSRKHMCPDDSCSPPSSAETLSHLKPPGHRPRPATDQDAQRSYPCAGAMFVWAVSDTGRQLSSYGWCSKQAHC